MLTKQEQRVAAGKKARELLELMQTEAPSETEGDPDHFWYTVAALAAARCGHVLVADGPLTAAMSDVEAARFEKEELPWGVYAGLPVGRAPADYIAAIVGSNFNKKLNRYTKSERFKKRELDEE